jgi:acyl-CoA synthetase (AMP-forming)/AMP-acid ligase II
MNAQRHHDRWRDLLVDALDQQAGAELVFPDQSVCGQAILAGADAWRKHFRLLGVGPGERVMLALPPGPAFVMALVGGWLDGLTLAPVSPFLNDTPELLDRAAQEADAVAIVGGAADVATLGADSEGLPLKMQPRRETRFAPSPHARLMLRTSGTTGTPRTIALSDSNLLSVVESHLPHLSLDQATMLSVVPWHHAFGLVINLLPALLTGTRIVRERSHGREPRSMLEAAREWNVSHASFVPLQVRRLAASEGGLRMLRGLLGGVVGGAPVSASVAAELSRTRLQAGYGQTEAGPGITLGHPGEWSRGFLGRAVGCTVRRGDGGRLMVRGENVCVGVVTADRGLACLDPCRELDTGDMALEQGGAYWFLGRVDHAFKLANGRFVNAAMLEASLRALSPSIEEAVVTTPDGEHIDVHVFLIEGAAAVSRDSIVKRLGGLGARVRRVELRQDAEALSTAKGSIDRARLVAA